LKAEKIKSSARKLVAISSDNDQHIPWSQTEELRDKFGAELIKIHNGGHLNEKAGYKEFPLLMEELNKFINE
jgi:predicted alpha/beta hydrolase family esterase